MEKFEYKIISVLCTRGQIDEDEFQEKFNGLGSQGWELISVAPLGVPSSGTTKGFISVFKRKIK